MEANLNPIKFKVIRNVLLEATEEMDSTAAIHPGWAANVDNFGNLIIGPAKSM